MVSESTHTHSSATNESDFDLHGIVGIRLLDAKPSDIATVKRQLGPIQKPISRQPDITVRFVDRIELSSTVRYLGVDDVGFTDDAFLVFRGKQKAHVKVQIPFDRIGSDHCEIVCESGLPAVPLLIPILNLTVLSRGALPLHASAFNYNGKGILVTGWAKGGKTEMLLAFAAKGAEYVGDEWVYISQDGQCMFGIPEPIRIWYWHLQEMPRFKASVKRKDLVRLKVLNQFVQLLERLDSGSSAPARLMRRIAAILKQQLYVQLPPEKLFGRTASNLSGKPETLFFVGSHADPRLTVSPIDPQEVARRIVYSLQEERKDFMSYYWKYRFAFPAKSNPLIEQAEQIQQRILLKVLEDKETYAVYHPYPVTIPDLYEVSYPYCS
jgi:hypothetical protein